MRLSTLVVLIAGAMGGAVGWWFGERMGVFTAYMMSVLATAAAMFFARRATKRYLP